MKRGEEGDSREGIRGREEQKEQGHGKDLGGQCVGIEDEREGNVREGLTRLTDEERDGLGYGQQEEVEGYGRKIVGRGYENGVIEEREGVCCEVQGDRERGSGKGVENNRLEARGEERRKGASGKETGGLPA